MFAQGQPVYKSIINKAALKFSVKTGRKDRKNFFRKIYLHIQFSWPASHAEVGTEVEQEDFSHDYFNERFKFKGP